MATSTEAILSFFTKLNHKLSFGAILKYFSGEFMIKVNGIRLSLVVAATLLSVANVSASDLGTIQVESSTIDGKTDTKKTEVSSTATISREDVEKINPKTITDLLSGIAGVTISNVGTDAAKVHIRGVDNQNYMGEKPGVAIVIDGVPVQETSGKINVDLDNIESIKVIKGGASYLYGNDALAGAVIITTKKAKGKDSSKVEGEVGSFNSKRFMASTNQSFDNSALQLQGNYRSSDGYWEDAYVLVKSINGKYTYYINDASDITFGMDYTQRKTGDGNSVSGTIAAETNPRSVGEYSYGGYYDSTLVKSFVTYSNNLDDKTNFMINIHKYLDDKTSKLARATKNASEIWNQDGAKGEYKTAFDSVAFMVGFDIQKNATDETTRLALDGSLSSDFKTNERINALYTEVKIEPIKDFTATFNFRYDNIEHQYMDKSDTTKDVSPTYNIGSYRAGFNYALTPKSSLYSSVSTGFRTPTVTQTSVNQQALKVDPTLAIPAEIKVETSYNYEIGVRGTHSDIKYDASIYQLDRTNYIGRIAGNYITSNDEDESNYDNVGDMRSRGFELSAISDLEKMFSFELAYTYLDAVFTNYWISQQLTVNTARRGQPTNAQFQRVDFSGNQVPRTSTHNAKITLNYQPITDAMISTDILLKGSYYADEANVHKMPGYEVVNLRANYKYKNGLEIFARIDNLLDTNYYQFVNINSSAIADMTTDATIRVGQPRAYYAGLRYKF
ncbi:MAG: TonB-dependent receptor [Sulfurimonas sp. CG08_land_8_20_14_0_20_36_33]|nr:MAG: TonB-dependent receptor [Sulfurimonas sp. CG23_combo_of_CG06-09_8_20_14_all_36_33]PIS25318.1 MAG: TonB-dependent receptor [Sulfurimonas sp. CG08_land_8_20_14_0_20_36_33]PIU33576.1 MAG: TonB-dependent receptor [Sulfurimonas sp. CG07_land_8_20_14_0_80_36_56]PIV04045.1 MAG: TonB-dependent receptor [Sulfurimonas sp. CG03_land_8_20_14_0_80_36_25]PIV35571.1 MAG: TonB-dependent receptor [Sulfurimonas sp. CG02_land_8_20_14_3_00_36_67]PIV60701.1 MAG: TonB-dependent receptor [Sulfurimonas sp. CG